MRAKKSNCKQLYRMLIGTTLIFTILIAFVAKYSYDRNKEHEIYKESGYNMAFSELVYYVEGIENLLAKATISSSSKNGIETLTEIYRQSDLAVAYLSQVPLSNRELTKTAKFLNQLSEYSHSLSKKSIEKKDLSQEDLDNIKMMHEYSIDLKNSLSQMHTDIENGIISWSDITKDGKDKDYVQEVDNISVSTIVDIDKNFEDYAGLIYDGAFSEHIEKENKRALSDKEVSEEDAKKVVKKFFGEEKVEKVESIGEVKNGNIDVYEFSVKLKESDIKANISISKNDGKPIMMTYPKSISVKKISREEANKIGKEFLSKIGYENMEETYFQLDGNTITVNYAYKQDEVIVYPDLIKLKMSLYDGEILGIETNGYINCHTKRQIEPAKLTAQEAKEKLNKNLVIESEKIAIIPTEWKTEIQCYEFKGKVDETEFLVYINTDTGEEEEILVIIETEGGTLTM